MGSEAGLKCVWKHVYLPKRGVYEGILRKAEAWNLVQVRMLLSFCTEKCYRHLDKSENFSSAIRVSNREQRLLICLFLGGLPPELLMAEVSCHTLLQAAGMGTC